MGHDGDKRRNGKNVEGEKLNRTEIGFGDKRKRIVEERGL